MNAAQIADTLPYYGKKVLLVKEHTTGDIVNAIGKHHKKHRHDYDKICEEFWRGNVHDTAKLLYDFNRKYVKYDVEHPDNQSVKSPGAIIHQGHGDCKHYASWIVGVVDCLKKRGYPIDAHYKFVADSPREDVHHVFAVVTDNNGTDYWVDPVLNKFNERPIFYNSKDVSMGNLYAISGSAHGAPAGLAIVGKSNVFKKLAHALQVNAANAGKAIKKVEHGIEVNAANAGKEIKKDVKKIEHIALNVSLAPARNAFLALLDLNALNLATRMADALKNHHEQTLKTWDKLGGNANKLVSAINNGLKHKAFYHKQAPAKKVSGIMMAEVPTLIMAYNVGPDHRGRMPKVSGIGEPLSIATMVALATAIIAAFSHVMKPDKGADQNAQQAATDGVANLVQNASDAMEAGQTGQGLAMMQAAQQGANALTSIQAQAGTAPDGTPTLAIQSVDHPQLYNAGTPQGLMPTSYGPGTTLPGAAPDTRYDTPADSLIAEPNKVITDFTSDISGWIKRTWESYKGPIIFTVVGVGIYKVATTGKKKRR